MGEFELKKNVLVAAPGSKRSSSSSSSKARNSGGFTRKCACLVKEQRARIYILRRCATMLLCWYIQGDD